MDCSPRWASRRVGGKKNRDVLLPGRSGGVTRVHFSGSGTQNIELGPKRKRSDVLSPVVGHDQHVVFAVTPGTRF